MEAAQELPSAAGAGFDIAAESVELTGLGMTLRTGPQYVRRHLFLVFWQVISNL
jgi:hypothetical protein